MTNRNIGSQGVMPPFEWKFLAPDALNTHQEPSAVSRVGIRTLDA